MDATVWNTGEKKKHFSQKKSEDLMILFEALKAATPESRLCNGVNLYLHFFSLIHYELDFGH